MDIQTGSGSSSVAGGVVILGAGNPLAADDGVGVRAARELLVHHALPPGVRILDVGVVGPDALVWIREGERVVLLDAVRAGALPGTVHRLELAEVEAMGGIPLSVHDLGLPELLRQARLLGRPLEGVLLGVEPARLEPPGAELSPDVAAALPALVEAALVEARRLLAAD